MILRRSTQPLLADVGGPDSGPLRSTVFKDVRPASNPWRREGASSPPSVTDIKSLTDAAFPEDHLPADVPTPDHTLARLGLALHSRAVDPSVEDSIAAETVEHRSSENTPDVKDDAGVCTCGNKG